jgi:hypothetical protein
MNILPRLTLPLPGHAVGMLYCCFRTHLQPESGAGVMHRRAPLPTRRHVELTIKRCMDDIFIDKMCLVFSSKHSKTRHMVWRFSTV